MFFWRDPGQAPEFLAWIAFANTRFYVFLEHRVADCLHRADNDRHTVGVFREDGEQFGILFFKYDLDAGHCEPDVALAHHSRVVRRAINGCACPCGTRCVANLSTTPPGAVHVG